MKPRVQSTAAASEANDLIALASMVDLLLRDDCSMLDAFTRAPVDVKKRRRNRRRPCFLRRTTSSPLHAEAIEPPSLSDSRGRFPQHPSDCAVAAGLLPVRLV